MIKYIIFWFILTCCSSTPIVNPRYNVYQTGLKSIVINMCLLREQKGISAHRPQCIVKIYYKEKE